MRFKLLLPALFVFLFAVMAPALDVGDPAPPLRAERWFHGDAVNPDEPDGKTIYVVEFWATWCPPCRTTIPHLNELHDRYADKGVVIIGVTTESEKIVKPFIEKMGIKYRVALASRNEIEDSWMKADPGIPHAFVVGPNGDVIWEGHPMNRLDEVLADVVAGSFDPEEYKEDASEANLEKLQEYLMSGEFDEALGFIESMLKEEPDLRFYQMKLGLLVQLERRDEIIGTYREMVERFWDDAENLNAVAWMAVTAPFVLCDPETALKAAERAAELSQRKDAAILDTLARVYYSIGRLPEAIRLQEEAIRHAADKAEDKELQTTLDYYRSAWRVSEGLDKKE